MADENESNDEPTPLEWPIEEQVQQLRNLATLDLQGQSRLGSLAFENVERQVADILAILEDLREEQWEELDPNLAAQIQGNLNAVIDTLNPTLHLTSADPNVQSARAELEARLSQLHDFFRGTVRPLAINARVRREIERRSPQTDDRDASQVAQMQEEVAKLSEMLAEARKRADQVEHELESREALIEAAREAAGASGVAELSEDYEKQANQHAGDWKRWGKVLAASIVVAIVAGLLLLTLTRPAEDASNGDILSHIALDLLVIGLLIYAVRVANHQFSVHRHLEAVARNKSAALSTFNRIVTGASDPDSRTALATVLAQSVFSSDETGFIDASGGQVTLIERFAAPVAQRLGSPPQ